MHTHLKFGLISWSFVIPTRLTLYRIYSSSKTICKMIKSVEITEQKVSDILIAKMSWRSGVEDVLICQCDYLLEDKKGFIR
tara:strand:- start:152 stop:394 length:243 start_codon:yes stop_codon:yes gene_type:complete